MSKRDYYETLEVSRDASSSELKKAFKKKAMKLQANTFLNRLAPAEAQTHTCRRTADPSL